MTHYPVPTFDESNNFGIPYTASNFVSKSGNEAAENHVMLRPQNVAFANKFKQNQLHIHEIKPTPTSTRSFKAEKQK